MIDQQRQDLAWRLAALLRAFPQVEAVALGGSLATEAADPASDLDIYVYTTALIPLAEREALVAALGGASRADMNLDYWDLGDEWFDAASGIEVDLVFWDTDWIRAYLARVVEQHLAGLGYTTAHWHTVRRQVALFDRHGWFASLQAWCDRPYPEALRREIIQRNHALLRGVIPSYARQVEKAVRRGDWVSAHQRVGDILNSYFDILFAFNRVLHPGEKRMLQQAARLCPRLPDAMHADVEALLRAAAAQDGQLLARLDELLDHLDQLLAEDGFSVSPGHLPCER